jgi:type I restriction enzyme S subunit
MSEGNALPDSWITVKVSDVGDSITGNTPSTQHAENYGGSIPYIKPPQLIDRPIESSKESLSAKGAKLARVLPPFSVLVSCIGNLGKTGINKIPVASNQQINAIVLFKDVVPTYLFYQAQSHSFRSQLESKATATTISIVNKGNFETVELNIAPHNEQHRIVAKIEELFSELDKGIENLKTAQAQLKVYRQALLKHAFEGKLTAQWRAVNQDKLETAAVLQERILQERAQRYQQQLAEWEASDKKGSKPNAPKPLPPITAVELAELPELPEGWCYTRIGAIIGHPAYGTSKKCDSEVEGLGVLRIPNVISGKVDPSDLKFAQFTADEIAAYKLNVGDILIIRSNGSVSIVGRCALVSGADIDYLYAGYLIRLRPHIRIVEPVFLLNAFSLHSIRKQIEQKAKSTSGVNNINTGEIQSLVVALCGIEEQTQISQEIEARLSEVDQLDQTITTSLQQAEALRQSILKKAFSGQLVPQDPHDEPASVLLERIKAGRGKVLPSNKSGRRN